MFDRIVSELNGYCDEGFAMSAVRFFKTDKGDYGEGDKFIGVRAADLRKVAKSFFDKVEIDDVQRLLDSDIHERRLLAVFILVLMFEKGDKTARKRIFDFYLKVAEKVNNWDLVDSSAPHIVGKYLLERCKTSVCDKRILYELARSSNLWEKRISIVSTLTFIRSGEFDDTLNIAEILLNDKEDLIHKATGWMLREVGKRDKFELERFLNRFSGIMPRIMLRYAVEHFSTDERKKFMKT